MFATHAPWRPHSPQLGGRSAGVATPAPLAQADSVGVWGRWDGATLGHGGGRHCETASESEASSGQETSAASLGPDSFTLCMRVFACASGAVACRAFAFVSCSHVHTRSFAWYFGYLKSETRHKGRVSKIQRVSKFHEGFMVQIYYLRAVKVCES